MTEAELPTVDVVVDTEPTKKKKKKSKTADEPVKAVEEVVDGEKKKKKKSKTEEPAAEAAAEEAPVEESGDKKKKKKKKTEGDVEMKPVEEEKAAEEEGEKKKKKKRSAEEATEEKTTSEETAEAPAASEPEAKKQKTDEEEPASLTVFIGGLPWSMTEEQIKADFAECGEIDSFRMLMDRDTGKPKGIAFCTYKSKASVTKALEYHEQDYGGRTLNVRVAEDSPPGGKGKGKKGEGKGPRQQSEKPEGCKSVIVKNMSWNSDEDAIRAHFSDCGSIANFKIITDRDTGASKGLCFIDFEEESGVDAAIKKSESQLDGRSIFVDYSGGKGGNDSMGKGKKGDKGKGKDGKGKGKDGKKGKGKGKKGNSDPTYAARNGAIQAPTGTSTTFDDSDDE